MNRPVIQSYVRNAFIAAGALCMLFAMVRLSHWVGYKRADCTIGVAYVAYKDHGQIKYDTNRIDMVGTKPRLALPFVVMPERFLSANAKPGDHVTVLYREENQSNGDGVVYSFGVVWREPLVAALIGACFICLGLWFRRHQACTVGAS